MGLQTNSDGTATIEWTAAGKEYSVGLPMPTLSQLGDVMDAVDGVWDELDGISQERNRIRADMQAALGDDETDDDYEQLALLRKESRDLEQRARTISSRRLVEIVRTLAPGPDAETFAKDPPAWAHSIAATTKLITHWNTVPFNGPAPERSPEAGKQQPAATSS